MVNPPDEPVSSSNGTYTIDIPSGINPQSYIIQVQDSRGIMVAASSFSHYTGSLAFNTTTVSGGDYVNQYNSSVDSIPDQGTHSNFTAQQQGPDGIYDTLTEAKPPEPASTKLPHLLEPVRFNNLGYLADNQTTCKVINGVYMSLQLLRISIFLRGLQQLLVNNKTSGTLSYSMSATSVGSRFTDYLKLV